jgi:RNA polymerase subunit RPABC4/transcription elongation factor Spt4
MVVGPCTHCGRLTDDVENICSHCQQRKEKKAVVSPELRSQIEKAIKMAEQYHKGFRVIQNQRGEILVFPTAVPVKEGTSVLYETGV